MGGVVSEGFIQGPTQPADSTLGENKTLTPTSADRVMKSTTVDEKKQFSFLNRKMLICKYICKQ